MTAYGTLCTEFYDLDKPSAPAQALAFYGERAREVRGRVLEPMCGSGRFLLPLSMAGVPIDGVDASPTMLEACRRHAQRLGVHVDLFLQDLACLELPHRYAMAFIPSGSIGLVTIDEDLHKVLSRICAHMAPNGTLLLELMSGQGLTAGPTESEPRVVPCADGSTITCTCTASRSASRDTVRYCGTYTRRRGTRVVQTEAEELLLRLYDPQALSEALVGSGFRTTAVSGASELAFLADDGCTLVEARADA